MASWGKPLRKRITYRDLGGGDLASHTAGWAGFQWEAGPVQVASYGRWGKVQVYAVSEAEGKRVIRHAASLAGYDLDGDPGHQWLTGQHGGGRIGRTGTMAVKDVGDALRVTQRDGPSGLPEVLVPG